MLRGGAVIHVQYGFPIAIHHIPRTMQKDGRVQTGQVHITLQLVADESGPTEIGGLILSPAYRGHKAKLGSLLSVVRFHFMGLHPEWFA
ncbi:MAG: arginine N-succinyltransferase, partial [Dehalococcoidia bacterium]